MDVLNPKAIIDREIRKTRRAVNAPAELFDVSANINESVFVRNRNVEYDLIKTHRGQYLDIEARATPDDSPNWVNITSVSLGANFSPLPVNTVMESWCRLSAITSATNSPWNFRFGASYRAGFMMSSTLIRFRPNWITVGGTIVGVADNGAGLFRITTTNAHGRNTGETVYVNNIASVGSINNKYWRVTVINSTTLDLQDSGYVAGWTSGGNINQHIKFNVYNEDGLLQDSENLSLNAWYRIVMEVQNEAITMTGGNGLLIGPYFRNQRIRHRSFSINTPTHSIAWDFTQGNLFSSLTIGKPLVVNPSAEVGKVQFIDDDLVGNNLDLIEQTSPYRLWKIRPRDGFVTPENFGAIKQFNTSNTSDEVDATPAIQACMDSSYNVLGDGYYYQKNLVNITQPKLFKLLGTSDGTQVVSKDESLGCFYQGKTPSTMYRIFSGGVRIEGGMFDVSNCVYNTANANLAADYRPPAVFEYSHWKNLIQEGSIETFINGNQERLRVFNGGHYGVSFDCSRDFNPPKQEFPNGFGEMHYVYFKIAARFIRSLGDARLGEPHQDYTAIINHPSINGFKVTSATADGDPQKYIISSPSNYAVAANAWRILTFKWGTHSSFSVKVRNTSGDWITRINDAIVNAGFSVDTSKVNDTHPPAFKAEARVGGGSAQSFTIRSNQSTFKLTCVRPCLPTVFEYEFNDVGCKYTAHFETADVSKLKAFCQTATVLCDRGADVDGYRPTEWGIPKVKILGDGFNYDIQTIDLGKGNETSSDYKANTIGYEVGGIENEPFDSSLVSFELNQSKIQSTPKNVQAFIRNHRHFSHTRYTAAGTGKDGFIGALDNVLAMANKKWPAVFEVDSFIAPGDFDYNFPSRGVDWPITPATPGTITTITNPGNIFDIGPTRCQITYDASFDEERDFVEISIFPGGSIDLLTGYVEIGSVNSPQRIQLIVTGGIDTSVKEIDLRGSSWNWHVFDGFNNGNTVRVTLRLIGVKNKSEPVVISQLAGVSKNFQHTLNPFLSNAGGVRIFNTTEFEGLRIKDTGTTYRTIVPQASPPATPTTEQIRQALVDAGIFF